MTDEQLLKKIGELEDELDHLRAGQEVYTAWKKEKK